MALAATVPEQKIAGRQHLKRSMLFRAGSAAIRFFHGAPEMLRFLGQIVFSFGRLISGKTRLRWSDL